MKTNVLYLADNLPVLRALASDSVDLIYLDPPFNSQRRYVGTLYDEKADKEIEQSFDDTWRWDQLDVGWLAEIDRRNQALASVVHMARQLQGDGTAAYMCFMGVRLLEMRRVLKDTGSIYLHCDPTANFLLRAAMEAVFPKGYRNEIVWCYTGPSASKKNFPAKHDTIIRYSKGDKWTFNLDDVRVPYTRLNTKKADTLVGGSLSKADRDAYLAKGKAPESWWTKFSPVGRLKKERTGWATQKPLALLERIIKASSNEGDVVLDPFAGCQTACVAAYRHGRRFIGIEQCKAAEDILYQRLVDENDLGDIGKATAGVEVLGLEDIPPRQDEDPLPDETPKGWPRGLKDVLYGRQRGFCNGCEHHYRYKDLAMDHVTPRSKGGKYTEANGQLLCAHCNSSKGSKSMDEWEGPPSDMQR